MHPQAARGGALGHGLCVCHEEAEDDSPKVAQVEEVVRLCGRGEEVGERRVVDLEGAPDDGLAEALDGARRALLVKLKAHDGVEDARHGLGVKLSHRDDVEPPEEARGDEGAAAAGGAHRAHVHHVDNVAEGLFLEIVPPVVVHELPEDLDGRLRAVDLLCGHVEVVDKDNSLLAHGGPVDALAALVELGVNDVLRLQRGGLRGEAEGDDGELVLVQPVEQVVVDVDRLARPRGPHEQQPHAVEGVRELRVLHADVEEEGVPGGVDGGDNDLVRLEVLRKGVARHHCGPQHPLLGLYRVAVLVDGALLGEGVGDHVAPAVALLVVGRGDGPGGALADEVRHLVAARCVDRAAHAPREGEEEDALHDGEGGLLVERKLVGLDLEGGDEALEHLEQRPAELDVGRGGDLLELPADELDGGGHQPLEEALDRVLVGL
mmetsp:Transcript_27981/g.68358  ORF Transcript_27981/g.68358 Transcript_27981/m.68358 type:complete len:434 (+) Transcript_27981:5687-6988(+)